MIKKLIKEDLTQIANKLADNIVKTYNSESDWYLAQVLDILKNPNFVLLVKQKARNSNSLI